MVSVPLSISAEQSRRLILNLQGLTDPHGRRFDASGLLEAITRMGFVQVDSIQTVHRAHHMILYSRNRTYRPKMLNRLLEKDRALFEHWTHDASVIPTAFYPVWRHKFRRTARSVRTKYRKWHGLDFEQEIGPLLELIAEKGPVRARDLENSAKRTSHGWWDWHAGKTALEFLWHIGELAITRREAFQKVYDLSRNVLPAEAFEAEIPEEAFIDWACRTALERLGFGTAGEIAGYWNLVSTREADAWAKARLGVDVLEACVEGVDSISRARIIYARPDLESVIAQCTKPPPTLRVLSPFDPLIRDRKRLSHLFGFDYRIEVFVPKAKRQYGYYVFPLLEGDRMIGRIDMTADRKAERLDVRKLWLESKVRFGTGRRQTLDSLLHRIARFADCRKVAYAPDWADAA
ncbi:MAG: winged helix DNA-binding domain-containing protein [Rhodospirillaceae bacterium]|nr:winged helix DNA-binding domain-containing protein [Rhodospirillaceae bacterium]